MTGASVSILQAIHYHCEALGTRIMTPTSAPIPDNETERIEELDRYGILDTPPELDFDDLTLLASHICQTPIALITLVDREREWFKSKLGLDISETPREVAFCSHAIMDRELLIVRDAVKDPRFSQNPLVLSDPNIRFYAGAPLISSKGHPLGTLCVIDREPRELTPGQIEALRALSRQVMVQLEIRRQNAAIAQLNRKLTEEAEHRKEAEKLYRHIVENASDIIYKTDARGHILYANKAIEAILKYDVEDVIGIYYLSLIHPDHRGDVKRFYRKQWTEEVSTTFCEIPVVAGDGALVWLGQHVELIAENGAVTGFQALARNVTERKRREFELQQRLDETAETQRLLETLLERYISKDVAAEIISDPKRYLQVGGDKREVTILFCDLRGFTALAETLAPDTVVDALNMYLTELIDSVFALHGTVDKFHGDAVMCFFSEPDSSADHAIRAAKCALDIRRRVKRLVLPAIPDTRLSVGIGINSGKAVVGTIGSERRMDHTVIGDVVNVAQRLQSMASPDQILLSASTCQHAEKRLLVTDLGAFSIKGRQDPIQVFELLGVSS